VDGAVGLRCACEDGRGSGVLVEEGVERAGRRSGDVVQAGVEGDDEQDGHQDVRRDGHGPVAVRVVGDAHGVQPGLRQVGPEEEHREPHQRRDRAHEPVHLRRLRPLLRPRRLHRVPERHRGAVPRQRQRPLRTHHRRHRPQIPSLLNAPPSRSPQLSTCKRLFPLIPNPSSHELKPTSSLIAIRELLAMIADQPEEEAGRLAEESGDRGGEGPRPWGEAL
jgi:hypothetical protein